MRHDLFLQPVANPPVDKISSLVFAFDMLLKVCDSEVGNFVAPHSQLDLPAGHIGVDQQVRFRINDVAPGP